MGRSTDYANFLPKGALVRSLLALATPLFASVRVRSTHLIIYGMSIAVHVKDVHWKFKIGDPPRWNGANGFDS